MQLPHENRDVPVSQTVAAHWESAKNAACQASRDQFCDALASWLMMQTENVQLFEANMGDWEQLSMVAASGHQPYYFQTTQGNPIWRTAFGVPAPGELFPKACRDWQV